jgi:hypothetical protein
MNPDDRSAPFLVMAHHRSGSNFMNDVLQAHPQIECLNEPLSMHTRFFRDHDLDVWTAADFDPVRLHGSLAGDETLRDYVIELRSYLMRSRRGRIVGFKDTCLFGKIGWLQAFVPGLKVVFLRREPRAIVSSVLRSNLASLWRYAELVPPVFARLFPGYRSRFPDDDALRATELVAMSVAARYELARCALGSQEHLELRLEDLIRQPAACLDALVAFLGAPADPAPLAFVHERQSETRGGLFSSFRAADDVQATWRQDLTARQLAVIDDVMSAVPKRFGTAPRRGGEP